MKKLVIFAVGSYTLLMAASLVFAQVSAGKLAAERCSGCHDTARICGLLGNRSLDVWQQTVERMRGNGAQLSDDEAEAVTEYLAAAKPNAKPLCAKLNAQPGAK
ncbi:MAG: hypothetical protein AUJ49_00390 [Desulfovibrionaceae bacterium CG1_02_65_16]|nr:MAG: hypothetical protein AUJ49_00390 [Desulfovibrionaceae bacterium CG1_02_65_16]